MTADQASGQTPVTAETIQKALQNFLQEKARITADPDQDLFASGQVSSMFAMELVVYLEQEYGISIVGGDLKLDNFRTVDSMAALVVRLRDASGDGGA